MKIVMICEFYGNDLEYQENLLVRYYLKHGHDVTVITSTFDSVFDYYNDQHDNSKEPVTYYDGKAKIIKLRYRYNILYRLRAYTSIKNILNEEKPDLIFVHDIMLNILEAIRYKKQNPNCKMILDYHADYSNSGKNWLSLKVLHGLIRGWFLNRARPHLSKIFPIVPASTTFLHEVYGVPLEEMEVLPLGADTDLGASARNSGVRSVLREKYAIAADDIVIFSGGKLAPPKRTELLISAFKNIDRSNTHLFIVGAASDVDSKYKEELQLLAQGCKRVHFLGWMSSKEIYNYLASSDIAVFPASQSILWQQAISMGLPLLVGDTGHQDPSYLSPYGNVKILRGDDINLSKLQVELTELIDDGDLRSRMASGALKVSDELLNWDSLIVKTLRFNNSDQC